MSYFGIFTSHIIEDHPEHNGHEVVLLQKMEGGYLCHNKLLNKEVLYEWYMLRPK